MVLKKLFQTTVLLTSMLAMNGSAWQKGPITDSVLTSLFVDMYLNYFKFHTDGKPWSDSLNDYVGAQYSMPDGNELYNANCFSWPTCGHAIVLDGTDAQVAQTGLTRAELARRVALNATHDYHVTNFKTPLSKDSFNLQISRARTVYAAPRVAPSTYVLRPAGATYRQLSLSWNDRMDYGNSSNWITIAFAPQDLADPRQIAGRAIKDWIKEYWWGPNGGDYIHPTPFIEPNFAPDFSSDHHYDLHNWYAYASYCHPDFLGKVLTQLKTKDNLEEQYTSPYSNLRHLMKWGALTTAGNGWLLRIISFNEHPPLKAYTNLSWASAVYKDPVCRALVARSVEEMSKRKPTYAQPYGTGWDQKDMQGAYLITRLLGGSDTVLSYANAVKRLHGTYWYRNYRYGIHRTPDKLVIIGWNQKVRSHDDYWKIQAACNNECDSVLNSYATAQPSGDYFGTTVTSDNDSLRPDDETAFPVLYNEDAYATCAQGQYRLYYPTGHKEVVKNNRNDAVLNSTGFIPHMSNWQKAKGPNQYQSFCSFYDKTCISLVQIEKGSYSYELDNKWLQGFGNGIIVDTAQHNEDRICYYEQGNIDLKQTVGDLTGSKWFSVNGRIGVATVGGAGVFNVMRIAANSTNNVGGVVVGWNEPLKTTQTRWVDMGAAYYTDTPPEQVDYLQSKLIPLDSLLPSGWKGLVSETPDSQRVLAISRFHSDSAVARVQLSLPEGAPVFESATAIRNGKSQVVLGFDTLQTLGQTLAFYVTGESDTVIAEQIGDITVRLKGTGTVKLVYLSRADENTVDVNGVKQTKTKAELKAGLDVALSSDWTVVRVSNWIDEDHTGPAVEIKSPQYCKEEQTEMVGGSAMGGTPSTILYQPDLVNVGASGLNVSINSKDRSGVAWVKLYLDWDSVGIVERDPCETSSPYTFQLPQIAFGTDSSIHALHAIACDVFGNVDTSVSVPFRVKITGGTSVERANQSGLENIMSTVSKPAHRTYGEAQSRKVEVVKVADSENGSNIIETYIKPDIKEISFNYDGKAYRIELSAKHHKVSFFRCAEERRILIGEAVVQVLADQWYVLKVTRRGNELETALNGKLLLRTKN